MAESRGRNIKKKEIMKRWGISYMSVILIPMLVFLCVSIRSNNVMNSEVSHSNELLIRTFREKTDFLLSNITSLTERVTAISYVREILYTEDRDEIEPIVINNAITELNHLKSFNSGRGDFYLSFPRLNIILDGNTYNTPENYFDIYQSDTSFTYSEWSGIVNSTHRTYRIAGFNVASPTDYREKIMIVRPISFISSQNYANLILVLDRDQFLSLQGINDSEEVVISDRLFGLVLFDSTSSVGSDQLPEYVLKSGEKNWEGSLNTDKLIISAINSTESNLKYVILKNKKQLLGEVIRLRNLYIFSFLISLVGGCMLVWGMLRKQWANFESAMDMVKAPSDKKNSHAKPIIGEYRFFSEKIDDLQDTNEKIGFQLKEKNSTLRAMMLRGLIDNSGDIETYDTEELGRYGIKFQTDTYFVLLLSLEGTPKVTWKEAWNRMEKSVLDTMYSQNIIVYPFTVKEMAGFIVNPPKSPAGTYPLLESAVSEIPRRIEDGTGCTVDASCSDLFDSVRELSKAYLQAEYVREYKDKTKCEKIVFYHEMLEITQSQQLSYTVQQELAIIESLRKGDEETTLALIDEVINANYDLHISPRKMRYLLFNIAGTILKVYNQKYDYISSSLAEVNMPSILQSNDFDKVYRGIRKTISDLCNVIILNNQKESIDSKFENKIYEETLGFINENYDDKALCVTSIADEMDMSLVRLSKIFKKYHGSCISDYINHIRINHAKSLLSDGDTIEAASFSSGFGSVRTFMRVFKNKEGITPGKYRDITVTEK